MSKRQRTTQGGRWTARRYTTASASTQTPKKKMYNSYTKGYKGTKTNKQLTKSIAKLWKGRAIKRHYVQDTATTSVGAPTIMELTGLGAGEAINQHEGNKVQLRGLNVHGYVKVTNSGGVPSVSHPTRWNVMVVSTTLDVGIAGVPSYANLYDTTNLPATMASFDGFRQLNSETLSKVKILAKKSFTLSPQTNDGIATAYSSTYPGFRHWSIDLKLGNAIVEYRDGTSTAINRQLYIMLVSNSTGAAGNLGLEHAFISKLTFYDVE